MPKHKVTKQVRKIIRQYASMLPESAYKGSEKFFQEVEDLSAREMINNAHGQELTILSGVKDKVLMETDRYYPVNHFRRLKKAYEAEGWPGVYRYAQKVDKDNKRLNAEDDVKQTMVTAEQLLKHKIQPLFNISF